MTNPVSSDLPELPEQTTPTHCADGFAYGYTPEQMREYAMATASHSLRLANALKDILSIIENQQDEDVMSSPKVIGAENVLFAYKRASAPQVVAAKSGPVSDAQIQEIAAEAFHHALSGGHLFDLYKLPKRAEARALLTQANDGKES